MKKTFLILFTFLLVLSGCGDSADSTIKGGDSAPKNLVVALGSETAILDPQDNSDGISYYTTELIFDKLVNYDKEMKVVPGLAKEWSTSEDGKKITFKLREGVKFTDGAPVNAEAIKYSFDRVLNPENKLVRRSNFEFFIESLTVDSEYQVTVNMKIPYGGALAALADSTSAIVSPKATKENPKNFKVSPVGSGPYKLKEWIPGSNMVLEANLDYWGEKPKLKTITFKTVTDNAARTIMLENGEADVIIPIPAAEVERLKGKDSFTVQENPTNNILYIGMDMRKAPFNDVRVRQALNYAVDKETIIKKVVLGLGKAAEAPLSTLIDGISPIGKYPYDPEKAKKMLAEAGVKPGTKIKLWTPEGRYLMDRQIAEYVQSNLQSVGFEIEFQKWEWGAYNTAYRNPNSGYDLFLVGWFSQTNEADRGTRPSFSTKGTFNYSFYSNPQVDALIQKGMVTTNQEERKKIYYDALKIVHEEAPWIFLAELKQTLGVRKNVENVYQWKNGVLVLKDAFKK